MKLSYMFDPSPMYTSNKIVVKHISVKETVLKLTLSPKFKVTEQNNTQGNKNIPVKQVTNDLLVRIEKGKQRSGVIR